MKATYRKDLDLIQVEDVTDQQLHQLNVSLTKQIEGWHFKKKHFKGSWDGKVSFLFKNRYVPSGLWMHLYELAKRFNFDISFGNLNQIVDKEITYEEFEQWANEFFEGHKIQPRDYQLQTAYRILKFRKCLAELATSAGKTLIVFMVLSYLKQKGMVNNMLIIVPSVTLVEQIMEDFEEYDEGNKVGFNIRPIFSGAPKKGQNSANLYVGTFQSLVKKDKDFFADFELVAVDECHRVKAKSIREILQKANQVDYRFGVTGTVPKKETLDHLTLMSFTGPVVNEISAADLMAKGYISNLEIEVQVLNYAPQEIRDSFFKLYNTSEDDRKKLLKLEQEYLIYNTARRNHVCSEVMESEGNSILFFHRIKYGENLYDYIKQNSTREVHYIDGNTAEDKRQVIKELMEEGNNKILVVSFGTFSTGISIKNIQNIFFSESFKSDQIIRQSIGRGLRLHENKDKLRVVDFVDDYSSYALNGYPIWKNYLRKHGESRMEIYKEQNFPFSINHVEVK